MLGAPRFEYQQQYICVDGRHMLVGALDFNAEDQDWWTRSPYHPRRKRHRVVAWLDCTNEMWNFCQLNFEVCLIDTPPPPLLRGSMEHSCLMHLIASSQNSLHIETTRLVSAAYTQNQLMSALAARLVRAYNNQMSDPLVVLLLVNRQPDDGHGWRRLFDHNVIMARRHLQHRCEQMGTPWRFVRSRLCMGSLCHTGEPISIRSNFLIVDGHTMLLSSSSLCDRGLGTSPCDFGLAALTVGPHVIQAQQQLLALYWSFESAEKEGLARWQALTPPPSNRNGNRNGNTNLSLLTMLQQIKSSHRVGGPCLVTPWVINHRRDERPLVPTPLLSELFRLLYHASCYGHVTRITWKLVQTIPPSEEHTPPEKDSDNYIPCLMAAIVLAFIIIVCPNIKKKIGHRQTAALPLKQTSIFLSK